MFFFPQVHRVLPQWLAQPHVIHRDIKRNLVPVSDVPGLSAPLVKKLQNNGIQHLFPGNDTGCVYCVCSGEICILRNDIPLKKTKIQKKTKTKIEKKESDRCSTIDTHMHIHTRCFAY